MSLEKIKWGNQGSDYHDFTLKGVPFRLVLANHNKHKTTDEFIVLLKNKTLLNTQARLLDYAKPKNMVELGLYEGGSAIFWHLFYDMRYLGFDILERPQAIASWIKRLGLEKEVRLEYKTSQSDEVAINSAVNAHFGEADIDVVIDDASHQYHLSRRSFEILFPRVRNGGIYCLEDWSWAHANSDQWQRDRFWGDGPALTNLLFEVTMLMGTKPDWFSQMNVIGQAAYLFSTGKAPRTGISFDRDILKQSRTFTPI
jgi:cephalosporin hydroxylase